ncbi:glycosyltransferase family 39 protein [Nitratiruptor sp. YY09-18]|uniref:glycosyltransferase family 39 protein n=1 Tax=Nitratiruptor sp. YY09-18 TaxID=2724901 RepID=UPI001915E501|nr:glycosyltransferase family 39 protein [Nitratiruptor sp. YY09-18]BCD68354.1 hypothetical protein NitYY0918_C1269 [Nitratiruptor sp. YY09-18]
MIYLYLFFYALVLFFNASRLGIGSEETKILFESHHWIHYIYRFFYQLFGSNLIAVRLPSTILMLANIYLFFLISKKYLQNEKDALFATVLFSLLPAVLTAGVVISYAPFILFFILIYLLLFFKNEFWALGFAFFLLFLHKSFLILFIAVGFYYLYKKNRNFSYAYFAFATLSYLLYGFDFRGKPQNYFFDTFALFSAIFSPLLFLYFFYVIYRILIKEQKDIVWFISGTSFLIALFLSFRQKVSLEDFAPYAVLGTILMVRLFLQTLRVRLPKYRRNLLIAIVIVVGALLINDIALIFNEYLFAYLPVRKHFLYENYFARALAKSLKSEGIKCIDTKKASLQRELRFYGIKYCKENLLNKQRGNRLTIYFHDINLGEVYVTKSNKNSS